MRVAPAAAHGLRAGDGVAPPVELLAAPCSLDHRSRAGEGSLRTYRLESL